MIHVTSKQLILASLFRWLNSCSALGWVHILQNILHILHPEIEDLIISSLQSESENWSKHTAILWIQCSCKNTILSKLNSKLPDFNEFLKKLRSWLSLTFVQLRVIPRKHLWKGRNSFNISQIFSKCITIFTAWNTVSQ